MLRTLLFVCALLAFSNARLLFVSEIFRHGARASDINFDQAMTPKVNPLLEPMFTEDPNFPNGVGMLTASGMRQQYLLGVHVRKEYIEKYKLLNATYDVNEFYIQSTQVPRTIQSAECQLLGIYPLGSSVDLKQKQVKNAVPNIEIENLDKILQQLGLASVIDRFQPIPVHNYDVNFEDDVLGYANCPLLIKDYNERVANTTFWKQWDDVYGPKIYPQLSHIFGIPEDQINFMLAFILTDLLYAEHFQGVPPRYNFTDEEWNTMKSMQIVMLMNSISDESSKILASRYLRPIVEMMKKKVGLSYNETATAPYGDSKMIAFSSHDLQVSHILKLLAPENLNLTFVDYASHIFIELHHEQRAYCDSESTASNCYYVSVIYNGQKLNLPGCFGDTCHLGNFLSYFESRAYSYEEIQEVCFSNGATMDVYKQTGYSLRKLFKMFTSR